jgi:hypothetical protein
MSVGDPQRARRCRVAVVIPAWDDYVPRFLPRAIASVTAQDEPARVIVVDNASTVPIPAIDGVQVVETGARVSRGAARNVGLELVTEPFVVFLDADDTLLPGALGALVAGLDSSPTSVAHVLSIVDARSGRRVRAPRRIARAASSRPGLFAALGSAWPMMPMQGATILRTDVAKDAGGYGDRDRAEDWMLAARMAARGRVTFGSTPALLYRRRSGDTPASTAERLAAVRAVRAHLRADPERGWAARLLSPATAAVQAALLAVRPIVLTGRTLGGTPRGKVVDVATAVAETD